MTTTPISAAPAPVVTTAPTPKTVTLAEGTMVPVRLVEEIDTKTAKAGDTFHATTASNLTLLNYNVVPTGTTVTGRVVDAKPAGRLSGAAELTIELVSIRLNTPNGLQDVSVVTGSPQKTDQIVRLDGLGRHNRLTYVLGTQSLSELCTPRIANRL